MLPAPVENRFNSVAAAVFGELLLCLRCVRLSILFVGCWLVDEKFKQLNGYVDSGKLQMKFKL